MANRLMVVIPCYNEEEVLPETSRRLTEKMHALMEKGYITEDSKVLLVNDGSKDRTWEIITQLHGENPMYEGLKLSRNRGHQNALLAGLMTAKGRCDISISMDADLQDDMDAMDRFIEKYQEGCEIVYGVRSKREKDSFFKRETAQLFYRLMSGMGVDIVFNHADYRLMSNRALEALSQFEEVNLFLRGIAPLEGFQNDVVYYERSERFAGESKYPLKKMLAFAIDGITSFSVKPLRLITNAGIVIFVVSLCMLLYTFISWITGSTVAGWTSTLASIWMIGGIQLLSLGVIGEYIGKIYNETKRRPRFIIDRYLNERGDAPVVDHQK
ncbi:MAG: glycosyltransferase family 2 protein [Clostridiales bacterium]|nr:glycosyltransferase family 2 protein [Clostridiales bacterium]